MFKRILSITQRTEDEIRSANLMTTIVVEEFIKGDPRSPFHLRVGQEAMTMGDDYLKNEEIFLLNLSRDYRLRVKLKHRYRREASVHKIKSIRVKPQDGMELNLEIKEVQSASGDHEVLALFKPEQHHSAKLISLSQEWGEIEDKYVRLKVVVEIATKTSPSKPVELRGVVFCKMVTPDDPLLFKRAAKFVSDKWRRAPQWIRTGARGAVILSKAVSPVVAGVATGDPSVLMFAKNILRCLAPCLFS